MIIKLERSQRPKTLIKLVAVILLGVAIYATAGIMFLMYLQQYTSRPSPHYSSNNNDNRPWSTSDEFYQRVEYVEIGMSKEAAEDIVGKPDLCSRKIRRGEYELQHCGYDLGDPETYHDIVYMNGEVWGKNSVVGSVDQISNF